MRNALTVTVWEALANSLRVAVDATMQPGHLAIPNGYFGNGAEPNEFTATEHRDWLAGTPWHKTVPARLEPA